MMRLKNLNIRQRYHLIVLVTLLFAGCMLLASLYFVIKNYANAYTSRYWQDHTTIFAESAQFAVLMGAKSRTDAVVNAFAHDKNILKAAIFITNNTKRWRKPVNQANALVTRTLLIKPFSWKRKISGVFTRQSCKTNRKEHWNNNWQLSKSQSF